MAGLGSSPALVICETSQVLLAGVSGSFPVVLPFRPTYRLARLNMSEIILKGTLNQIQKKKHVTKAIIFIIFVLLTFFPVSRIYVGDGLKIKLCFRLLFLRERWVHGRVHVTKSS